MAEDTIEKIADELPLPRSTDFVENEPGKNATKIEIDMEKNAPFILEFKQRLDAVGDPEKQKVILEEFQKATGISFEKAFEAMENKCTVIINKEDGSCEVKRVDKDSEEAKTGEIIPDPVEEKPKKTRTTKKSTNSRPKKVKSEDDGSKPEESTSEETPKVESEEESKSSETSQQESSAETLQKAAEGSEAHETDEYDPELEAEITAGLDAAKADPSTLKFTEDDIQGMIRLGVVGDEVSVRALVESLNHEIDEIIQNKDNPESEYHNPETYDRVIRESLAVKISMKQSIDAADAVTDPQFIQEIFNARYPWYVKYGPASIYDIYIDYLNERTKDDKSKEFFFRELTDKKKIQHVMKRGDDDIFSQMMTRTGKPMSIPAFLRLMFDVNKPFVANVLNIKNDENFTVKQADSIMTVFLIPFVRLIYKKLAPGFKSHKMERKYIVEFLGDILNLPSLPEEKREAFKSSATKMWTRLREIELELIEYEKVHFDANGRRKK